MSTSYENKLVYRLIEHGFPGADVLDMETVDTDDPGTDEVERVPAWRTAMRSGDVAICLPWLSMIVEVKKVAHESKCRPTGGGNVDQWEQMHCFARQGIESWYAVRHTRGSQDDRWRFHRCEGDPSVTKTLYREEGLTLPEFVDVLLVQSRQ